MLGEEGDAQAHLEVELDPLDGDGLGDGVDDAVGHFQDLVAAGQIEEDDAEFVAPQSPHQVRALDALAQAFPHLAQDLVPAHVSQGVVDLLEIVQVHGDDRGEGVTVELGVVHELLQLLGEANAVGQVGK